MEGYMTENALLIFTGYSPDQVRLEGESRAWTLAAPRARNCEYAVLCYNANTDYSSEPFGNGEGYLVGIIAGVVPSREVEGRWCVRFSHVARISKPNLWPGNQMPINYTSMAALGISADELDFKPVGVLD
jgi:hypothetical protein